MRLIFAGLLLFLCTTCGSSQALHGRVLLEAAPREADLPEPQIQLDLLRPAMFGYGGETTSLKAPVCTVPLEFAVGEIDPRFELGRKQAITAITEAAGYWESALGRTLFRYSPESKFVINFVYDERQEMTIRRMLKRDPEVKDVEKRYQKLEAERQTLLAQHNRDRDDYQSRVAKWNSEGGAPPDVLPQLNAEKESLTARANSINAMKARVFAMAAYLRARGAGGTGELFYYAGWTNRTAGNGVIWKIDIEIYMFTSWMDLKAILAHELGHAIGLGHVASRGSLMYGGSNPQRLDRPTPDDLAEFRRVCP